MREFGLTAAAVENMYETYQRLSGTSGGPPIVQLVDGGSGAGKPRVPSVDRIYCKTCGGPKAQHIGGHGRNPMQPGCFEFVAPDGK